MSCIPAISFAATKGVKIKESALDIRSLDNGKAVQCSLIKGKATAGSVRKSKGTLNFISAEGKYRSDLQRLKAKKAKLSKASYNKALTALKKAYSAKASPCQQSLVTVKFSGSQLGAVRSSDNQIQCGTKCSAQVKAKSMTFTSTPATNAKFVGWSGACSGTKNQCTVNISKASEVNITAKFSASFNAKIPNSSISVSPHTLIAGADHEPAVLVTTQGLYGATVHLFSEPNCQGKEISNQKVGSEHDWVSFEHVTARVGVLEMYSYMLSADKKNSECRTMEYPYVAREAFGKVAQIFASKNGSAFAAIKDDGSIVTWGNADNGATNSLSVPPITSGGVATVKSFNSGFLVHKVDGSFTLWGHGAGPWQY